MKESTYWFMVAGVFGLTLFIADDKIEQVSILVCVFIAIATSCVIYELEKLRSEISKGEGR